MPRDDAILCNRSATYLGLKRYVPACHDAIQAAEVNPDNWKAHWRQGLALMSMGKKKFRSKQAIAAFEKCGNCSTLPENKREDVRKEYMKARALLEKQDAEVSGLFLCYCYCKYSKPLHTLSNNCSVLIIYCVQLSDNLCRLLCRI